MWPAIAAAIGMGMGMIKAREENKANRQRQMAESWKTAMAPWTGSAPGETLPVKSETGAMMEGGMSGLSFGLSNQDKLSKMWGSGQSNQ